jgi:aminopeptidase
MREANVDRKDLGKWADFLIDHSLGGVTSEDRVMIKGERIAWPLMEMLERKVIEAGGIPDVYLIPPNNDRGRVWSATMGRHGRPEQLGSAPDWHGERYDSMTKYIEVLGAEDPKSYTGLTAAQVGAVAVADKPYFETRVRKRWVITLYPTPSFAAMEGIPLDEYSAFIVGASTTDPSTLEEAERRLAPLFEESKKITIVTACPKRGRELTLELDIGPSRPELCYGLRNFPDGEIFTSPNANGVDGEIFLDLAVHYGGVDLQGIYLKLENGRIVEHDADRGRDRLAAIIGTDDGSKRLGEVALGMNPGLDRVLKHPLFVEKVGGTLHIAIGAAVESCFVADPKSDEGKQRLEDLEQAGVFNRSAQHVDIVADFRPGGCGRRVLFDDRELVVRHGLWVPA